MSKNFSTFMAAMIGVLLIAVGFLCYTSAVADAGMILHRGTDANTGVHAVTYRDSGGLHKVDAATLEAAGVSIWNVNQVEAYLGLAYDPHDGGGFFLGPDGLAGTPDDRRETEAARW